MSVLVARLGAVLLVSVLGCGPRPGPPQKCTHSSDCGLNEQCVHRVDGMHDRIAETGFCAKTCGRGSVFHMPCPIGTACVFSAHNLAEDSSFVCMDEQWFKTGTVSGR
jgi:hypothetical protein